MKRKSKQEYSIQTVTNALLVLQAFRDEDELGVTELSRRLGLHKNNVFRLLATLELEGFVEQSRETDRYWLGTKALELGHSYSRSRDLMRRARALLVELASNSGETAHLAAMQDFEVSHLDGEASYQMVSASPRVGRRLPVHCTALGKVLLGCSREDVRQAYDHAVAGAGGLTRRTEATIDDPHKFFEHIRGAAVQGFAVDVEECEAGLCCAAAPVFDDRGEIVAALSVSGPSFRLTEDRLHGEAADWVTAAARSLSRDLGYAS